MTNIIVVRVETTVCKNMFATDQAAKKWIEKQKDSKKPSVEYQVWHSPAPTPEQQTRE
jgi:hypothetical protein